MEAGEPRGLHVPKSSPLLRRLLFRQTDLTDRGSKIKPQQTETPLTVQDQYDCRNEKAAPHQEIFQPDPGVGMWKGEVPGPL